MIDWLIGKDSMEGYNRWVLVFQNHPGIYELIAIALLTLAVLVLSVYNLRRLNHRGYGVLLYGLRVLFLAGLVLLWLQPAIQLQKVLFKKNHVLILADKSLSMSLSASQDKKTRADQLKQFFTDNEDSIKQLAEKHHLHSFTFDESSRSLPFNKMKEMKNIDGEYTDLVNSIEKSLDGFSKGDVAGVLLFSDGVSNTPVGSHKNLEDLLKRLNDENIVVHTFGAGSNGSLKDIAVKDIRYDGFAFVHNKMTIEVDLASRGYKDMPVQVNLLSENRPISTRQIEVKQNSQSTVVFEFTPDKVGRYVYTVTTPVLPDDAMAANNQRSFIVDVIRDKIRVLHVCGHPDYDEQYFRRFLKNNPNVDLISFFILRTNADLGLVQDNELSLIPFPTRELFSTQLHTFDLLIFQNFTYRGYEMSQYLPNIRRFVMEGGAFMVIGGDVSYGPGGYDGTAIEPILPFEIYQSDKAIATDIFKLQVSEEGYNHPIMQISRNREANREAWGNSHELYGMNLGLRPYPDSLVLARHPITAAPVMATRSVGKGRVFASAIDSSWLWHNMEIAKGGSGEFYRSFYNNVIRWLIKDPELKHLKVKADNDSVSTKQEIRLDIRLTDDDFQPRADADVKISVIGADGKKQLLSKNISTDKDGIAGFSLKAPDRDGMLSIQVESRNPSGVVDKEELLVFVSSHSKELDEVNVDFEKLQNIADSTGGKFYQLPKNIDDEVLFTKQQNERVGKKQDLPIWNKWWFLTLLVLLIAFEWWLRKRRRLN